MKGVGACRSDMSRRQRDRTDARVNCGTKAVPPEIFSRLKQLADKIPRPSFLGVPAEDKDPTAPTWPILSGDRVINISQNRELLLELQELARHMTNSSARIIDGSGEGEFGKHRYKNADFFPLLIEKVATARTRDHVDYDSQEVKVTTPIYTLYVVLEAASPVQFSLKLEEWTKHRLNVGEALFFPSHKLHNVKQAPASSKRDKKSPHRVAIICHFSTTKHRSCI